MKARNEHGIHPPFLFELYTNIIKNPKHYYAFDLIETVRKQLLKSKHQINIHTLGEESIALKGKTRELGQITSTSLKPAPQAQFLFRLAHYLKAKTIIDLGTSLGITTAYLASQNSRSKIYTFEGNKELVMQALKVFDKAHCKNITHYIGMIENTLENNLSKLPSVDLAFIDANHKEKPTLEYYELLKSKRNPLTCLVFDDIHWSTGMQNAWHKIIADKDVTISADLFHVGLVFFNPDFSKQHFYLRM